MMKQMMNKLLLKEKFIKYSDVITSLLKENKKYIIIGGYSFLGLLSLYLFILFVLPTFISWFIPFPEKDKVELKKLEAKILEKESKTDSLEKKLEKYQKDSREGKLKLQKANLSLLKGRLALLKLSGSLPTKQNKNIKKLLKPIPIEPFSGISQILFERTGKGGWYYDLESQEIYVNDE